MMFISKEQQRHTANTAVCLFIYIIKTITKYLDVNGHHQPDLKTNRTVYASCLKLDSVIGQLKGQLTCHACESGHNLSCASTVV